MESSDQEWPGAGHTHHWDEEKALEEGQEERAVHSVFRESHSDGTPGQWVRIKLWIYTMHMYICTTTWRVRVGRSH